MLYSFARVNDYYHNGAASDPLAPSRADQETPCAERSRLGIHAGLARKLKARWAGMRLQNWPGTLGLDAVGFGISFNHLCRGTELRAIPTTFFCLQTEPLMGWLGVLFHSLRLDLGPFDEFYRGIVHQQIVTT